MEDIYSQKWLWDGEYLITSLNLFFIFSPKLVVFLVIFHVIKPSLNELDSSHGLCFPYFRCILQIRLIIIISIHMACWIYKQLTTSTIILCRYIYCNIFGRYRGISMCYLMACVLWWTRYYSECVVCASLPAEVGYYGMNFHKYMVLYTYTYNWASTNTSSQCFFILHLLWNLLPCSNSRRRYPNRIMGIRMPRIIQAKQVLRRSSFTAAPSTALDVPRGYFAVYVGEQEKKRYVIPISFLNQPLFKDLLSQAEEEFGFDHPMGGLTIPCREDIFIDITSRLS